MTGRAARRLAAGLGAVLATLGCGEGPAPSPPSSDPPTIVLISIDTLRADHLGFHGYDRDTSPFLDQLAAEGVFVEQAVVATHGTTPSHASMLTSVPQEVHGVGLRGRIDDVVPSSLHNLPEVLRDAGYATVAVTGGGNIGRSFGFDRGFDIFDDRARGAGNGRARLLEHLDGLPTGKPLFLFFHTYEVHSPYDPPPDLEGRYGPTDSEFSTSSENLVAHANTAAALAPEDLAHVVARYDEGIRHADRVLRRLFKELGERGLLDDAIVAVTSDYGEEFGEHGGLVHRDLLYEELVRVPMIFWGPRVSNTASPPTSALSLDVAPTLVSCAGLPVPDSWIGRDLLCSEDASEAPETLMFQYGNRRYGVRTPEWKLIVSPGPDTDRTELYHLPVDPAEQADVAQDHPEVVARLTSELRRWRAGLTTVESDAGFAELDEEERQRLEALGYLDAGN